MSDREISLRQLEIILAACEAAEREAGETGGPPVIRLGFSERLYLMESCKRGIAGDSDPLKLKRTKPGRPPKVVRDKMLAAEVIRERQARRCSLDEAFEVVADRNFLTGKEGGAVENAHERYGAIVSDELALQDMIAKIRCAPGLTDSEREAFVLLSMRQMYAEVGRPLPVKYRRRGICAALTDDERRELARLRTLHDAAAASDPPQLTDDEREEMRLLMSLVFSEGFPRG